VIIDVFNHFHAKSIFERLSSLVPGHVTLTASQNCRRCGMFDARLRLMDEFDACGKVPLARQSADRDAGDAGTDARLARIANDGLAELCRKYPDRFPAFTRVRLPMNNVVAACARPTARSSSSVLKASRSSPTSSADP